MSTQEVAQRVRVTGLERVVTHRTLILPQLVAPAVAGHKLQQFCGFSGDFGPVRIHDLPSFLRNGKQAAPEMRTARFPFGERLRVVLVEIYGGRKFLLWTLLACLGLAAVGPGGFGFPGILTAGLGAFAVVLIGFITGALAVPALLPCLPCRAFAAKGLLTGALTGVLPAVFLAGTILQAAAAFSACAAFASWFAMHYTGSTPFTSLSGVDREMRRYMPVQGGLLVAAVLIWVVGSWL